MITPPNSSGSAPRLFAWGEWVLVLGMAAMLAWTTLCLGGYLAETMIVTAWTVFGLAALGGLLWLLAATRGPVRLNGAALLPVPFLVYALASVWWVTPAKWQGWHEWLLWLQMWLVFVLALHFGRSRRQTWVMVSTFLALGLTGVALAAYQRFADPKWLMLGWVHGWTQAEQFGDRSAGMFGVPNSLAALLELMVPACLALLVSRATRWPAKVFCGWVAALFVFAVVLTGSRGGWISLSLALMVWPLLGGRQWRKRIAGTAVILLLAVAGCWSLYRFSEAAHGRIQPFLEGRFESSRPIIWKVGLQIWREHPWVGSGAASYNVLFDRHRPRGFTNDANWTHNDYLNTLGDYGIAGCLLWVAAGAGLLWLGWRAVQRARREGTPTGDVFASGPWRLGLLLGLLAFALHLGVDFHTKIPALAFAAAIVAALLLRGEPELGRPVPASTARALGLALALLGLFAGWRLAAPHYRAEALRYLPRRIIDKNAATGQGELRAIIPPARAGFEAAVKIDPTNAQAWGDLSYADVLSWHVQRGDLVALGRLAEARADRAMALCPVNAEFWVRKGVARDMQGRKKEGETCFRRALELAPNSATWWYYYAYHLSAFSERKPEARQAVETCLSLDPSISAAVTLRQHLTAPR